MKTLKEQLEKLKVTVRPGGASVDRAAAVEANKELISRIAGPNNPKGVPPSVRVEPAPKGGQVDVWPLLFKHAESAEVLQAMKERDGFGRAKYGQGLKTFDGRDAEVDALQELLDAAVYLHKSAVEAHGVDVAPDARTRELLVFARNILMRRQ